MKQTFLRCIVLITLLFSVVGSNAQTDSCNLRISLLTCSPGEELYSAFGHTALRVVDAGNGIDYVFNYGTFDDSDPTTFYANFTKGLMYYALSAYPYTDFVREYQAEQRSVIEQVLQLSCAQKQTLLNALRNNAQEENRFYYYYFHNDNCTTRALDMVAHHTGDSNAITFRNILPEHTPTFRNLIHDYLNAGHQPWSKFGIDLLLGANLDKKVTSKSAMMFLPDYLLKGFDSATVAGHPLVGDKQTVIPAPGKPAEKGSWFTPFTLFLVLFLLITWLSFRKRTSTSTFLRIFDITFFLLLGLLGTLLAVLWVIRVDDVCRNNWNLLWAFPTHVVAVFFITGKKLWVKKYLAATCILALLTGACWFLLPQQLNPAIAPILGIILVRANSLRKKA